MTAQLHTVSPEDIMALLDGELSPSEARSIETHLHTCPECSTIADQLRDTTATLAAWTIPTPPPRIEQTILPITQSGKPRRIWTWKPIAIGLTAVVAITIALIPSRHQRTSAFFTKQESIAALSNDAPVSTDKLVTLREGIVAGSAHPASAAAPMPTPSLPSLIARTLSLVIEVDHVTAARTALDQILTRHHSYAAQLNISNDQSATASLRIPADDLTAALAELKSLGKVLNESQSGEEVTQQHADLEARLKNARITEQRLQAILQNHTGKVSDILEVEESISRVRGEIEQMESEQKALEHRVTYATVDLRLQQKETPALPSLSASFAKGLHNVAESLRDLALFLAEDGPEILVYLVILALPAWLLYRRYRKLNRLN